jgi:hypothetical protein
LLPSLFALAATVASAGRVALPPLMNNMGAGFIAAPAPVVFAVTVTPLPSLMLPLSPFRYGRAVCEVRGRVAKSTAGGHAKRSWVKIYSFPDVTRISKQSSRSMRSFWRLFEIRAATTAGVKLIFGAFS